MSRSILEGKSRHSVSAKSQGGETRAGEGLVIFNKLTRKFVFSMYQSLPVTGTKHLQNTTRKNLFRHSCEVSDHLDRDHSEAKPLSPWRPGREHKQQPGGKTFSYEFFGGVNALVSQSSFNSITNWWPSLQRKPFKETLHSQAIKTLQVKEDKDGVAPLMWMQSKDNWETLAVWPQDCWQAHE